MNYDELEDNFHGCGKEKIGVVGDPLDLSLNGGCAAEIKADILVKEFQSVRIWGQVRDCNNRPVPKVLLKLLRCDCGKLSGIAHTISDCQGFYQFDLWDKFAQGSYKILASRPVSCMERVIASPCTSGKYCEPPTCNNCMCNNCDKYCEPPICNHTACNNCGKSEICKTCAYYDETTGTCCLKNEQ